MNVHLYHKANDSEVLFLYPVHGSKNVLRTVSGTKLKSFTGPNGRGITVREDADTIRSFSLVKCVGNL